MWATASPRKPATCRAATPPLRAIPGRATLEEAKALIEDGVPVMPLPSLPDEWN